MITLTKQVKVETLVALAEIGIPSKSEEILAILELAKELGGTIRAQDVNTRLLGRPEESPHGQRILMVVESYGLIEKIGNREDDLYRITEAGSDNLQKGQIMIPEEGSYILFVTEDALFNEAILKIERDSYVEQTESSAYFSRKNDRALREQLDETVQKPNYLTKYSHGYLFRQVADSNIPIQVNSISDKVARSTKRKPSVNVSLELDLGVNPVMRVQTTIGTLILPEICTETRFDKQYVEVLEALTSDAGRLEVLDEEPTLLIHWNSVNPEDAERFRKQITVERPTLWDFGTFERISFSLPILPASMQDAIAWANLLLRRNITTYIDKPEYDNKKQEVAAKFSKKYQPDSFVNDLTDFDEMVQQVVEEKRAGNVSPLYWRLIAPQDLNAR